MAGSLHGQDEANPALSLAACMVKMEFSCPFGIAHNMRGIIFTANVNPLLVKLVQSRWWEIGLILLLLVYGPC